MVQVCGLSVSTKLCGDAGSLSITRMRIGAPPPRLSLGLRRNRVRRVSSLGYWHSSTAWVAFVRARMRRRASISSAVTRPVLRALLSGSAQLSDQRIEHAPALDGLAREPAVPVATVRLTPGRAR